MWWAFAAMAGAEYQFPQIPSSPAYLVIAQTVFEIMKSRLANDTTACGGGLRWQSDPSNAGYDYKNAIANGMLFQLAGRLARYTGDASYISTAEEIWSWSKSVGIIDKDYNVYDGAHISSGCAIATDQWSYNVAVYLHGAAALYNYTSSDTWRTATTGLLDSLQRTFTYPHSNASNVLFEFKCEADASCDPDQVAFKAYDSRWLGKTAVLAPYVEDQVLDILKASANGALESCQDIQTCGARWYLDSYDGEAGFGAQTSVWEVVLALLAPASRAPISTASNGFINSNPDPPSASSSVASSLPSSTPASVQTSLPSPSSVAPAPSCAKF